MTLSVGATLGRYEIRSQLGAGGMGEVYLAWDSRLERNSALKILPVDVASDPQRMRRFTQEAKAASTLSHPNVAHIYEIDEQVGQHFIAMEYVEGHTLRQHMAHGSPKLNEALDVAIQVASALAAAHAAGIVHRDIKPENIMMRLDALVKVLDFGLAKLTERETASVDAEAATRGFVNTDILYYAGRHDQSIAQYEKTLELDKDFVRTHFYLGMTYLQKAMYKEAIAEYQKAVALSGGNTVLIALLGRAYAFAGDPEEAMKKLDELKTRAQRQYVPALNLALIHIGLGERDQAFEWLEKAYEERSSWLVSLKVEPLFDSIRTDPRFANLVQRVGL